MKAVCPFWGIINHPSLKESCVWPLVGEADRQCFNIRLFHVKQIRDHVKRDAKRAANAVTIT